MRVLEVGCGPRKLLSDSVGLDLDISGKPTVNGDAHHLPFRSQVFDLTLSFEMLEHVRDPQKCLKEMFRVTRETVLLSAPHPIMGYLFPYRLLRLCPNFDYGTPPNLRRMSIPKSWGLTWRRSIWYQQVLYRRRK